MPKLVNIFLISLFILFAFVVFTHAATITAPNILPPTNFTNGTVQYDGSENGCYTDTNDTATIRLYSYKTINGARHYSPYISHSVAFDGASSRTPYFTLSWTASPTASGYLATVNDFIHTNYQWSQDLGNITSFVDDGCGYTTPTPNLLNYNIFSLQPFGSEATGHITEDFNISATASTTVLSGAFYNQTTVKDVVQDNYTSAHVLNGCIVNTSNYTYGFAPVTYRSITPTIATISSTGNAQVVSNGTGLFNATIRDITRQVSCAISNLGGQTVSIFNHFTSGSLASYLSNQANALAQTSSQNNIYSYSDDVNHVWTRNASSNFIGRSMDLTAIPVWSDWDGLWPNFNNRFNGILVTPDIVLAAHHTILPGVGYDPHTFYFVDNSNNVITDAVLGHARVSNSDIEVFKLASNVSSVITPAQIFATTTLQNIVPPDNTGSFSVSDATNHVALSQMPIYSTNQFRTLQIGGFCGSGRGGICIWQNASSTLSSWYQLPISGDSGSPYWTVVNGHTVALGTWTTPSGGADFAFYGIQGSSEFGNLQDAITSLGSASTLSIADVSSFPTY